MAKLSDLIKQLIENPEDLSVLPTLRDAAVEYENNEVEYQTRVEKLQSSNRNLLKMIPVPEEPKQPEQPESSENLEAPTLSDGVEAMQNLLGGH